MTAKENGLWLLRAVRKNVSSAFGRVGLSAYWQLWQDPWKVLFELAKQERGTDLKTFWRFETEGGHASSEGFRCYPCP